MNVSSCSEILEDIDGYDIAVQNSTVYIVGGTDKENHNMSIAGAFETSSGKFKK